MSTKTETKPGIRHRLGEELRSYALVSGYLFVSFSGLLFYQSAMSETDTHHFLALGMALGKALILGKFILIGEGAGIGSRVNSNTMLHRIILKSFMFLLLLVTLSFVEEVLVGWFHGSSFGETISDFSNRGVIELIASALVMLLILVPLIAVKELGRQLGPGALWRMLMKAPNTEKADKHGDPL